MLLAIAAVLAILWIVGFTMFHVASFAIHLLIIGAVIMAILHFVRGRGARPSAGMGY